MFGLNDNTQKSNDDPAMLDNVKDLASQPAATVEPPQTTSGSPDPAASTTPAEPAFSPTPQTSGFNMPGDTSVVDATSATATTVDNTAVDEQASNNNPGHIEPAEGFSSNPVDDTAVTSDPLAAQPSDDNPLPDNTIPTPVDTSDENATSSEPPQISKHSTPSINSTDATTNSVTAPPELGVTEVPAPVASESTETTENQGVNHEELAAIKKEALGHLEGLTDHLEGTPEEIFISTMQLIQANDNHALLQKALEAAKKIEDDKARAQAMLDIVNETNYFAQSAQED